MRGGVLFKNDFDYSVIESGSASPVPLRRLPSIMTQTWHDVLFLHWPVGAQMVRALLPVGLELDLFDGQAYAAASCRSTLTNMTPRGIPALPGV